MEDPAEDVFASLVSSSKGNFRILEGIREATGFHLQRIINIVETMPPGSPFAQIRCSTEALLRVSEMIAERLGIKENTLGEEEARDSLPDGVVDRLWHGRKSLRFNESDLKQLRVTSNSLEPFLLGGASSASQALGNTDVERRPILRHGTEFCVVLPTAIPSAITRFVIETVLSNGLSNAFERALAREYTALFGSTPILGWRSGARIPFQRSPGGYLGAAMTQVDSGRFLHVLLCVDGLDGYEEGGLNGVNPCFQALSEAVGEHIKIAAADAAKSLGFRDGISVLAGCGFGRGAILALTGELPSHWRVEHIAAPDVVSLSWLNKFSPLSLWRLLDSRDAIEKQGVKLFNINGIINLFAWAKQLDGHLVPHAQLPDGFVSAGKGGTIVVRQNALRLLRHGVLTSTQPRRALHPSGEWLSVRKLDDTEFEEDRSAPLYADDVGVTAGKLRAVFIAPRRSWWVELVNADKAGPGSPYEYWRMLCCWLQRAAPILDEAYSGIPDEPVDFRFTFAKMTGVTEGPLPAATNPDIRIATNNLQVDVGVGENFDDAVASPENVAERAIVDAMVRGAAELAGESNDVEKIKVLTSRISPNTRARWRHRFPTRSFRDYIRDAHGRRPAVIDAMDDAISRIGIGSRIQAAAPNVTGSDACKAVLNDAVRVILDDLCASLARYERRAFIRAIVTNHEIAAIDREAWKRTAQANAALHDDSPESIQTLIRHIGELNACSLASRVLVEAAVCECPSGLGETPGDLDVSRLMASVMLAHHLGGWSDAVHWGAMEPRIRITPLGDIHMNHAFMDEVYEPFGKTGGEAEVSHWVETYADLYGPDEVVPSVVGLLESDFLEAWKREYDVSIDGIRRFLDLLDRSGLTTAAFLRIAEI